ncbi:MAG: glycosyltransferase family 39 protein [Caldilinea sp.]|nr:glycosyltransferase family 39 protein [Caldilinea sp.]MDW8442480.1 glycosyltransferase family 39 protein [Caldilineaceae bacterium]
MKVSLPVPHQEHIENTREPEEENRGALRKRLLVSLAAVGLLLVLGFWLRWRHIQNVSLHVDEFTTLWAARRTLELGAPLMPSGVLYTRGLLATYVTALAGVLAGLDYTTGRLPALFFSLATIAAVFVIGRRVWNGRVAWLAAPGLTLLPEAIVWGGRARFYAQLQFFTLLTVWAAFWAVKAINSEEGWNKELFKRHLLFSLCFLLALFSQEQTVLLYPPLLLGMALWRGRRWLLRREVWPAHALILTGMAVRYVIEIVGQPGFFETIQAERPYVTPRFDVATAWPAYAPLLVAPERLPWTLAALLAVGAALVALAQRRWRIVQLEPFHQATLFFAWPFLFVLLFILTLVGGQWREARYLFLVQPLWLLTGAAGAVWLFEALFTREQWRWAITLALSGVVVWTGWQPALAATTRQVEGYDRVFEYVARHRQPGDVVMTPQPPACAFVLGEPCDFYAVQRVYEEFVIARNGALVDRWSGARLLHQTVQLETTLRRAPRVWLVTDAFRLATRYENDFLRTVIEQFDVAFQERGVMALLAQGRREQPAYQLERAFDPPLRFGRLKLLEWRSTTPVVGEPLHIELTWQAATSIDRQLNTSLRLVSEEESVLAQQDGPPARGILPTTLFFEAALPDFKVLAPTTELQPGRYRLEVVVYDPDTGAVEEGPLSIGEIEVR